MFVWLLIKIPGNTASPRWSLLASNFTYNSLDDRKHCKNINVWTVTPSYIYLSKFISWNLNGLLLCITYQVLLLCTIWIKWLINFLLVFLKIKSSLYTNIPIVEIAGHQIHFWCKFQITRLYVVSTTFGRIVHFTSNNIRLVFS